MDKRSFIEKASVDTAGIVKAFHIPAFAQNRKIEIGLIGWGGYGMVITEAMQLLARPYRESYNRPVI